MKTTNVFKRNAAAFLSKKYRYIVNKGGTRSGKTFAILQLLIILALYDKKPTVTSIISETLPHLKRGAIRDFKNIMRGDKLWNSRQWNATENFYTFPNGSVIEFFSADQEAKVKGPARDRMLINECQYVAYNIVRQLLVRTTGVVWFDYNPTHEFYIDNEIIGSGRETVIHSTYKDNRFLTKAQIEEIESNKKDENWWRVYGMGLTGNLSGTIYNPFTLIDELPEHRGRMMHVMGLDFGYSNDPTALIDVYIDINAKKVYLDEVIYSAGLLNQDIAARMRRHGVTRTVEIFADAAEAKSIDELGVKVYKYNVKPCYKNDLLSQIQYMNRFEFYVTKRSLNIIKESRQYRWKENKDGDSVNVPIDMFNHAMDAIRYAVYTPLMGRIRPKAGKSHLTQLKNSVQ